MRKLASILAVLLVAAVAFTLLSHGKGGSPLNPIAQAAALTEESSGAKVSLHGVVQQDSLPQPIPVSGEGVFNGKTNRSQMTFIASTPRGKFETEAIGDGTKVYLKSPAQQSSLPGGDEWVGYDAALGDSTGTAVGANSSPSEQLDLLRAVSDDFQSLGQKKVRGVQTTGYRAMVDPDRLVDSLRERGAAEAAEDYKHAIEAVPTTTEVEVWIDNEKLVRQIGMNVHAEDVNSGETTSTNVTMDYYAFGIFTHIQPPDPSTVYDITAKIRAELGLDESS
jgi:hypothetical protein